MVEVNERKEGILRIIELASKKKLLLVLSLIFSIISAIAMLVPFISVYEVLNLLFYNFNDISLVSDLMFKWGWIALIGLVIGLATLGVSLLLSHLVAYNVLYNIRMSVAEHLVKVNLGYFNATSTGAIKKVLQEDVERIELTIAHQIPDLINVLATAVFMFLIFFSLNGWMALTCLLGFVVAIFFQLTIFIGDNGDAAMVKYFNYLEEINSSTIEYIKGMPVVKIFGQSTFSFKKFNQDIMNYKDWVIDYCDGLESNMSAFAVIINSFLNFVLPVGLLLLSNDLSNTSLAVTYLFFIIMVPGLSAPLFKLTTLATTIKENKEGLKRIDAMLYLKTIEEPSNPKHPSNFDIEFEDVSFSYENINDGSKVKALKNINFKANSGELTAIVGPSGSGKTTIANLIPRFWDVDSGEIKIGGINIKDIKTEELMDLVSFVFQDNFLFFDSIYENIRVGKPDATDQEIIEAAKKAQCHDFIQNLPKAYETVIGDSGISLSGGEIQRIAIARCLIKNSPILILDEPTSFSDSENEYNIQKAINELIKNKTVIIIAHRLSSIKAADNIIVVDNGEVREIGKHDQLVENNDLYSKMWKAYTESLNWTLSIRGGF